MLRAQSPKKAAALKAQAEAAAIERREAITRRMGTYRIERLPVYDRIEYAPQPKGVEHQRSDDARESRPMNAAEKRWVSACTRLGCVVCRHCLQLDTEGVPCIWHHIKHHDLCGAGMKSPHTMGLALCPVHHIGHGAGTSYHDAPEEWGQEYGPQYMLMALQVEDVAAANKGLR